MCGSAPRHVLYRAVTVPFRSPEMDSPDSTDDKTSDSAPAEPGTPAADAVNADTFHLDLEAGPILADILTAGPAAEGSLDDLHAALASLPSEGFADIDAALQHLTQAVDLFDVPTDLGPDASDAS